MDLPSPREIELEILVRRKDAQIAELTDEVTHLRQFLSTQPTNTQTDPTSLPPALVSLLLPHIEGNSPNAVQRSSTVTDALTQRVKVLQEENNELFELLKTGETGRLKDDVRALRRVVQKLEGALRESHHTITSLSDELEKSQAAILSYGRPNNINAHAHSQPPAPRPAHHRLSHANATNGAKKFVPTGPRAHKKPRLSEPQASPPRASEPLPTPQENRSQSSSTRRNESRERSPRVSVDRKVPFTKMEVDEDDRKGPRSPEQSRGDTPKEREREREHVKERNREHRPRDRERERDRNRERGRDRDRVHERERDRERERGREYDREHERPSRRNGGGGSNVSRRAQRNNNNNSNSFPGGDRTLAERMGL